MGSASTAAGQVRLESVGKQTGQAQHGHPMEPLLPLAAPCRKSQPCPFPDSARPVRRFCVLPDLGIHHSLPESVHAAAPWKRQSRPEAKPCQGLEKGTVVEKPLGTGGKGQRSSTPHLQAGVPRLWAPSLTTLWPNFPPWRVPEAPTAAPTDLGFSSLSLRWPRGASADPSYWLSLRGSRPGGAWGCGKGPPHL